jgi:hypothetical protein
VFSVKPQESVKNQGILCHEWDESGQADAADFEKHPLKARSKRKRCGGFLYYRVPKLRNVSMKIRPLREINYLCGLRGDASVIVKYKRVKVNDNSSKSSHAIFPGAYPSIFQRRGR